MLAGTMSLARRALLRVQYFRGTRPDRFKHDRPGEALLVSIEGASAFPDITPLETGSFSWRTQAFDLLDGDDTVADMETLLPEARLRRQALVRLVPGGRVRLEARAALASEVENARPDFAWFEFNDEALVTECEAGDLDAIDRAGALREAADALLAEVSDAARSAEEREIARMALGRLYAYAQTVAA